MNQDNQQPLNPTAPEAPAYPAAPVGVAESPQVAPIQQPVNPYTAQQPQYQSPVNSYAAQQSPYQPPVNPYAAQQPQYQPPENPYAAQQPQYQPPVNPQGSPAPVRRLARRSGQPRDLVTALLVGILSFIMTDCIIWSDGLGLGFVTGAVLLMGVGLVYLRHDWRHIGFYTVVCIAAFFIGGASLVFSADAGMKLLTLLCLMLLYACILMDGMALREWTPGTFGSAGDFFYTAFGTSFGKIGAGMYGLFHRERGNATKRKSGVGKALIGLLIALPLVLVLIALLSSADQAFQGMLKGIDLGNVPKKLLTLFLAIPVFILLFSQLFGIRDAKRTPRQESDRGIDPTILTFFLLGISLVYVAYLFSQLAYFFNGFMGFLPEKFTYAEYARRGFFELSVVSVINIFVVILGTALSKKQSGKLPLGVKLPTLFLCLFSLVLVFTEVAKMKMYMDTYGLTRLRILTTLFMIFLAVVFLALIVAVFVRRFPYLKVAVVAGVMLVIAINFVSVDRLVAEYNVWAYQSGVLKTVDVETITELGDAAVPALLKLAADDNAAVATKAQDDLYLRWSDLHEPGKWNSKTWSYDLGELKSYDWRSYNVTSYRARQLLLENEKLFLPADTDI